MLPLLLHNYMHVFVVYSQLSFFFSLHPFTFLSLCSSITDFLCIFAALDALFPPFPPYLHPSFPPYLPFSLLPSLHSIIPPSLPSFLPPFFLPSLPLILPPSCPPSTYSHTFSCGRNFHHFADQKIKHTKLQNTQI